MLAPQRGLIATGKKAKATAKEAWLLNLRLRQTEEQLREVYSRNSQSSTATPAEPGDLPFELAEIGTKEIMQAEAADDVCAILSVIAIEKGLRTHGKFLVNYSEAEMIDIESRV